ncbi:MAG: SDR family NAD(P)-dependent oxidoreductase [Gammaproteobacteria bacterium]
MNRLLGRRALIVGGSGGIGAACAQTFVREGAHVHVVEVSENADLVRDLGRAVTVHQMDITSESAWRSLVQELAPAGSVDVLVNAAGISGLRDIESASFEWWKRFQSINSDGVFLAIHYLLPLLKRAPSASIVNVGSTLALKPAADLPAYSASKGALRNLTRSVALHCANRGYRIRCNSVHPGSTVTPMMLANLGQTAEEHAAAMERRMLAHPYARSIGRLALPEDVANAVLFLSCDESAFVTGIDLPVDGGATI